MNNVLGSVIRFLGKTSFSNPLRCDVLVFDYEGSVIIKETILNNIAHTVLHVRYDKFYCTPHIIARFLGNLLKMKLYKRSFREFVRQLYRIYLLSCVQHIKPKVVLTRAYDSQSYHVISRTYKSAVFYAMTNGFGYEYPIVIGKEGYKISMPHLICHGRYEEDGFKKYGHDIDFFHPVGSVLGSFFFCEMRTEEDDLIKYDICLVSQCEPTIIQGVVYPEIRTAITTLDGFLVKYLDEHDASLCVALRSTDPVETGYFRSHYGSRAHYSNKDSDRYATYHAMLQSDVIVSFDSSAAVEAYGFGKKVLFVNLSGAEKFNIPVAKECFINSCDYTIFKDKLNEIRKMSVQEYQKVTATNRRYITHFDAERPAHKYTRDLVVKALNHTR